MSDDPIIDYGSKISGLMQERLRIKGRSLAQQIHRSGRRLPKRIKRAALRVDAAGTQAGHPKLARQLDQAALRADAEAVIAHLEAIDPVEVLKDKVLVWLAKVSALLILGFVGAVWYARSQGLI